LAVLAVEEASKSYSWSEAAINSQGSGQVEVPIEGSHAAKITRARSVLGLIEDQLDGSGQLPNDEILARAKDLAKDDNAAKQRGFYVDLEDGVVKDPGGIVPDEATAMIEMAETVIGMALAGALYHGLKKPGTAGG
jgi:AbiV family abortive infection protein